MFQEIWNNVFKVKIGENVLCLKSAPAKDLKAELHALLNIPKHPNVVHPLLGVVQAGCDTVDKFIIPFIEGTRLRMVRKATEEQKKKWKAQILNAVRCLHERGMIWGDAAPRNVIIEEKTEKAVLIDFGCSLLQEEAGSCSAFEDARSREVLELNSLLSYIDKISLAIPNDC